MDADFLVPEFNELEPAATLMSQLSPLAKLLHIPGKGDVHLAAFTEWPVVEHDLSEMASPCTSTSSASSSSSEAEHAHHHHHHDAGALPSLADEGHFDPFLDAHVSLVPDVMSLPGRSPAARVPERPHLAVAAHNVAAPSLPTLEEAVAAAAAAAAAAASTVAASVGTDTDTDATTDAPSAAAADGSSVVKPLRWLKPDHKPARGRRRRKQLMTMSADEIAEEKEQRLEKNRQSARDCRRRKKSFVSTLEDRAQLAEAREFATQSLLTQLRFELQQVKLELQFYHSQADLHMRQQAAAAVAAAFIQHPDMQQQQQHHAAAAGPDC